MNNFVLGIDLGASLIKYMMMSEDGRRGEVKRLGTDSSGGHQSVLDQLEKIIHESREAVAPDGRLTAVGLGTPGLISRDGTIIGEAVNIPGWRDVPLQGLLSKLLKVPVFVANDVSLTALGEDAHGAARGIRNMVCISIGTGVGGGLIVEGELYQGGHGLAAEIGHLVVEPEGLQCNCGQKGCLEQYAAAGGITANCLRLAPEYSTLLAIAARENPEKITAELIYDYVRKGDDLALTLNDTACKMLARGVGQVLNLLSPDMVVLCGGVMRSSDLILPLFMKYLETYSLKIMRDHCTITAGELGADAGVIGAAVYAKNIISDR